MARSTPFNPAKCGTRLGRDQHRHRGEPVCEPCRIAWNESCAQRQRDARARGYRPPRAEHARQCEQCGSQFSSRNSEARFCSMRCLGDSRRKVYSRELVHIGPKATNEAPATPLNVITGPKRTIINGPCAWCGEVFTAITFTQSRYCSKGCGRNAAKYRHGRFVISQRARLTIYERDGWTCGICSEPVDPDAGPSDPWAATLDHIIPQSRARIPDHSPENLRTAHRWCNSVRGDLTYYSDADLQSA